MGSKFRLNIDCYQSFWDLCSALTNYHIKHHPLRDFERGVFPMDDEDQNDDIYDEEESEHSSSSINESDQEMNLTNDGENESDDDPGNSF